MLTHGYYLRCLLKRIQEGRDEESEKKNVEGRTREVEKQGMNRGKQSMTLTQGYEQLATVAYV